jgi:hypothetical protein
MEHRWNKIDRENPKYSGKNLSQFHFVHHNSHMDWPGIEPGPPQWERHSVTLPAEIFVMRKRFLTLPLAKPIYNAEAILKNFELFIYGDVRYINS